MRRRGVTTHGDPDGRTDSDDTGGEKRSEVFSVVAAVIELQQLIAVGGIVAKRGVRRRAVRAAPAVPDERTLLVAVLVVEHDAVLVRPLARWPALPFNDGFGKVVVLRENHRELAFAVDDVDAMRHDAVKLGWSRLMHRPDEEQCSAGTATPSA